MLPVLGLAHLQMGGMRKQGSDVAALSAAKGKSGAQAIMSGDKQVMSALSKRRNTKRRESKPLTVGS